MPVAIIRHQHAYVNMRKLQVKRSSFLIEPANRATQTPRTDDKVSVLEILGEILSILAIFIIGWIAYVIL